MSDFDAARAMRDVADRGEQLASGEKVIPVSAAVIAVLAALATLLANHSSVTSLSRKNEAVLLQAQATDQYGHYESRQIKAQVDRSLLQSGIAAASSRSAFQSRLNAESAQAQAVLKQAQALEARSEQALVRSEASMGSYESYEVSATLFEVSIVFVSITALMRPKVLLLVAALATLVGLGFLIAGALR